MRTILLALAVAALGGAQTPKLGVFTNSGDVGSPAIKGSATYDAGKQEYRVTGAGANMWAKADQFQFVWREVSGDVTVSATLQFLGEGIDHRKAGIMLRPSLDTDAPYVDWIVHGNGMAAVQWRNTKGDITNGADFPVTGPGKYRLKLVRAGSTVTVFLGKGDAEVKEALHTQVALGNPILVGLAVCSHNADASDTVVFSDVAVEPGKSAK
jgi:TolB protein